MNATLPSEVHLIHALQQRRSADFALLYDAYAPALYGMLLRLVKDPACAGNLLQEAFVKIWSDGQHYNPQRGRLFSWMLAITRNLALDQLAANRIEPLEQAYMPGRSPEGTRSVAVEADTLAFSLGPAVWQVA